MVRRVMVMRCPKKHTSTTSTMSLGGIADKVSVYEISGAQR